MSNPATEKVYPAAPLEMPIGQEQHQHLLAPVPPTYEQATGATAAATNAPQVVVVTQPVQQPYGPHPMDVQCPFCHNYTRTNVRFKPTTKTHLMALLLCVFQLYCCVCLPYCIGSCMSVTHYCGMCDQYLGTYAEA